MDLTQDQKQFLLKQKKKFILFFFLSKLNKMCALILQCETNKSSTIKAYIWFDYFFLSFLCCQSEMLSRSQVDIELRDCCKCGFVFTLDPIQLSCGHFICTPLWKKSPPISRDLQWHARIQCANFLWLLKIKGIWRFGDKNCSLGTFLWPISVCFAKAYFNSFITSCPFYKRIHSLRSKGICKR